MPLYKFLHNLLTALVQITNKMGLQKNVFVTAGTCLLSRCRPPEEGISLAEPLLARKEGVSSTEILPRRATHIDAQTDGRDL
jgi:hypothetical protein